MITKLTIRDNSKSPIKYISDLPAFENGKEYIFKDGINIIVGENGAGKTTLLKLLCTYLLVDYTECGRGPYGSNVSRVFGYGDRPLDGIDVYADYTKNTFRLCHADERIGEETMSSFSVFKTTFTQKNSSTGESVVVALDSLFQYMFGKDAKLYFNYAENLRENESEYLDYIKAHTVECPNSWTILMDEPDRNLSISNIEQIQSILSYHKPQTQLIAVIHNPLLIYSLSRDKSINFIELTDEYVEKVIKTINKLTK